MKTGRAAAKSNTEVPRDKPEQVAFRIAAPLRDRIAAVAAAMSDEAQETTLSDVARKCLIGYLPKLEQELGLTAKPRAAEGDTEQWVAGAKQRAVKANAKT